MEKTKNKQQTEAKIDDAFESLNLSYDDDDKFTEI